MTSTQPILQIDPETEAVLDSLLAEIRLLNGSIRQDQIVIDRLKAESKVITDHTDALLSSLRVQLDALRRPHSA